MLVGLTASASPWVCYLFDREVAEFGQTVEAELDAERAKGKKGNPRAKLRRLLTDPTVTPGKQDYMSGEQAVQVFSRWHQYQG